MVSRKSSLDYDNTLNILTNFDMLLQVLFTTREAQLDDFY